MSKKQERSLEYCSDACVNAYAQLTMIALQLEKIAGCFEGASEQASLEPEDSTKHGDAVQLAKEWKRMHLLLRPIVRDLNRAIVIGGATCVCGKCEQDPAGLPEHLARAFAEQSGMVHRLSKILEHIR